MAHAVCILIMHVYTRDQGAGAVDNHFEIKHPYIRERERDVGRRERCGENNYVKWSNVWGKESRIEKWGLKKGQS